MTRTGPQKIPGAALDLFFGDGQYSGSDMESNCGVIHTTEGAALVSYDSGAVAPNVTGVPDFGRQRIVWHQHFDVDESARALVNSAGGVETNRANAFQIELVGTCDPTTHASWTRAGVQHIYWPEAPDWALAEVAWLMRWLRDQHGVPLMSGLTFKAYPASYGANNGVRMSFAQWQAFKGWCGHQHVPENLHGDPGSIDIKRLLALAGGDTTPVRKEDDDMTPDQIATAPVFYLGLDGRQPPVLSNIGDFLNNFIQSHARIEAALSASNAAVAALAQALGQAHGVDTAQVVAAVREAIVEAVLHVDVTVTGTPTAPKGN